MQFVIFPEGPWGVVPRRELDALARIREIAAMVGGRVDAHDICPYLTAFVLSIPSDIAIGPCRTSLIANPMSEFMTAAAGIPGSMAVVLRSSGVPLFDRDVEALEHRMQWAQSRVHDRLGKFYDFQRVDAIVSVALES
jgi:hypothetical protein